MLYGKICNKSEWGTDTVILPNILFCVFKRGIKVTLVWKESK